MKEPIILDHDSLTLTGNLKIEVTAISESSVELKACIEDYKGNGLYFFDSVECSVGSTINFNGIEVTMKDKLQDEYKV